MTKKVLVALALSVLLVPQADAKTKEGKALKTIFTKCGIGAEIFDDEPILAGVTNFFLPYSSLIATSTYYSSDDKCGTSRKRVAVLVAVAYDKLESEISEGKGKYFDTLAELSGKSKSEIREEFSKVISSEAYTQMSKEEKAEKLFSIATF